MPKTFHKHKILLDENMPPRGAFPKLNERFDVKHVSVDLHQGGIADSSVYQLALKHHRIIVSQNWRDFLKLVGSSLDEGVIAVTGNNWVRMDAQLTSMLTRHGASFFRGKVVALNSK
ncbi:DUF5615 family PIN-like protein [Kitasatospora sp. NPDC092039]|uniref:DUF5615 family PIN-like protein n=1 Tax=Kitasatospora sp. NPDC092039 TaxID=3364086 RepID=UPI00381C3BC3